MESSPTRDAAIDRESMCSTPYGINGILTRCQSQRMFSSEVLNALRHQWNPHPCLNLNLDKGVWVLNALRHQWNPHMSGPTSNSWDSCAQRLTASMESSQPC